MTLLASRLRAAVAVLSVAGAVLLAPGARDAARLLVAQDDPVTLGDLAVGKAFDASRARTEIEDALAAHDADLAVSLLALADARDVAVTQTLRERVRAAGAEDSSAFATAAKFARGFAFGDPRDGAELAGTLTGDLFVYGDVRDIVREGSRIAKGEAADELVLALAGAGLAITAGTYATLGAGAPARAGLSVLKAAGRAGRASAKLVRAAAKAGRSDGLVKLAGHVGAVQAKAGTRAALDGLRIAQNTSEVGRLATLAAAKGGKTRAILKVAGRSALVVTAALWDLASWVAWLAFSLLSACASFKRLTERAALRFIRRRKAIRELRAA